MLAIDSSRNRQVLTSNDGLRRHLLSLDPQIGKLQRHRGRKRQRAVARADQEDPPASRKQEPAGLNVIGAIMSRARPTADHLGDVVVTPQATTRINVVGLAARMCVDVRREARVEAPPCLSPLPPCISIADFDPFTSQEVRER